jgi:hypothetical protein
MPIFFIQGRSKIYPNWDFWFENTPSGNPAFKSKALPSQTEQKTKGIFNRQKAKTGFAFISVINYV